MDSRILGSPLVLYDRRREVVTLTYRTDDDPYERKTLRLPRHGAIGLLMNLEEQLHDVLRKEWG